VYLAEALPLTRTTEQVTEQVTRFLALLKNGALGVREAMEALGLKHRPTFLANYLQPALKAGLIEMTQPESPKSPTQKYRMANPTNRTRQEK
jgi:ATP-dependent DNA helicase RecG